MKQVLALLKTLGIRLIGMLGLMLVVRSFFAFYNHSIFLDWGFFELCKGARIDASIIVYAFSPYFLCLMFLSNESRFKILKSIFFGVAILLLLLPEMIDVIYYEFVQRRMTSDVFTYIRSGGEFWELLPQFLLDFWWVLFVYSLLVFFVIRIEYNIKVKAKDVKFYHALFVLLLWIGLTILLGRGGFQRRPLELSNATQGVSSQNAGLVMNSSFSLLSSFFVDGIERKEYFSEEELNRNFSLEKEIKTNVTPNDKNVVIIILESFSQEYTGFYNPNGASYTPFFDSLLSQSYTYTHAYANGKRSVEALPAILAGLPSLMSTPYIFSTYATNKVNGLPKILKERGYQTSFYHGGHNGTMGFDGFCSMAGIDNYYGLDEYKGNREDDYDGNWGIFDEPYLQYFAKELDEKKEPFFSSVFTLSSHHPYTVPDKYADLEEGTLAIHKAVRYSDIALKKFFEVAQTKSWFSNTVFVLLADHTAQFEKESFGNAVGKYRIPMAVYESGMKVYVDTNKVVQQLDVPGLVLERLGYNGTLRTFGNASEDRTEAIMYNDRMYQVVTKNDFLQYNGMDEMKVYTKDNNLPEGKGGDYAERKKRLQLLVQKYSNVLLENDF